MQWSAVIINFNAGAHLAACVASLEADTSAGVPEIVVVDNGSTDDSLASIAATSAHIVMSPGNIGYARAANLGIAAARSPGPVAVLNPDIVVASGTASAMLRVLDDEPRVGVVAPRMTDASGADYPSAREIPGPFTSLAHIVLGPFWRTNPWSRRYRQEHLDPNLARDADWLSGAALWLRRSALDEVGGWDERYFMFLEDVDLCVRLRAAGWRARYEPGGSVVHAEGVSRRSRPYASIVDHHRGAFRYASAHWRGIRRLGLPVLAAVLSVRAAVLCGVAVLASRRTRALTVR